MNNHVATLFLAWHEKKIGETDRGRIERHLEQCSHCKHYYGRMSAVFEDRILLPLKEMIPDPYLPKKIQAVHETKESRSAFPVVRWSFAGIGVALAIVIGIFIGKGLYDSQQTAARTSDNSEYYGIIAQQGSIDSWNYGSTLGQEEQQ